jgi:hypothetical protein
MMCFLIGWGKVGCHMASAMSVDFVGLFGEAQNERSSEIHPLRKPAKGGAALFLVSRKMGSLRLVQSDAADESPKRGLSRRGSKEGCTLKYCKKCA